MASHHVNHGIAGSCPYERSHVALFQVETDGPSLFTKKKGNFFPATFYSRREGTEGKQLPQPREREALYGSSASDCAACAVFDC